MFQFFRHLYNRLIETGRLVHVSLLEMDDVGMLGTPEQVEAFIANPPRISV